MIDEYEKVTIEKLDANNKYLDPTRDCMFKDIMQDE